ncbi:hypothetical protein RFI_25297 [Reticulomyxa filosa]|uniref:Uncharacterized protein n=1 Tax=Reticulomyxa filosa TaxID=46433 RepID=X6MF89_RETFI|nr:hypothetical protein RFI_25297 [Reticulomyxa filosa]|eukprot:ETO12082.1 hypothetical protein RFI_25297 [Reticulomyxa filosa]
MIKKSEEEQEQSNGNEGLTVVIHDNTSAPTTPPNRHLLSLEEPVHVLLYHDGSDKEDNKITQFFFTLLIVDHSIIFFFFFFLSVPRGAHGEEPKVENGVTIGREGTESAISTQEQACNPIGMSQTYDGIHSRDVIAFDSCNAIVVGTQSNCSILSVTKGNHVHIKRDITPKDVFTMHKESSLCQLHPQHTSSFFARVISRSDVQHKHNSMAPFLRKRFRFTTLCLLVLVALIVGFIVGFLVNYFCL